VSTPPLVGPLLEARAVLNNRNYEEVCLPNPVDCDDRFVSIAPALCRIFDDDEQNRHFPDVMTLWQRSSARVSSRNALESLGTLIAPMLA
jgi:hypothetical protein